MLKKEPAKTPEPRQRKDEEANEQKHEHLIGHNDPHCLKSGEERALVLLEGRIRRDKRDCQAHGRDVRFIHHHESLYLRPEVITIYNIEHARWIDSAASDLGIVQDLLIRVSAPGDVFFDGQEGGFSESEVPAVVDALSHFHHVRLVGVTAFPCVRYNHRADEKSEATPNLHTILRAAATMRNLGVEVRQINAPGNTSTMTMPLVAPLGATHVESGHALTGTTPNHAFFGDALPEHPAYVYVSEISHHVGDRAYAYGGGLFHDGYQAGSRVGAYIGSTWEEAANNGVEYLHDIQQIIDYHVVLRPGDRCKVGDTALLFYRTQMQMTRSYTALLSGLSGKRDLKVHYLFDHASTALDDQFNPVDPTAVRKDIDALLSTYSLR